MTSHRVSFPRRERAREGETEPKVQVKVRSGMAKTKLTSHLSPVFEEVLPEDVLGGVLVVQHLGEEGGYLLSRRVQFHLLTLKNPTQREEESHIA